MSDLVERCRRAGCGARKAKPCTDWDCPQQWVPYAEHAARITELEGELAKLSLPGGLTVNCLRLRTCSERAKLEGERDRQEQLAAQYVATQAAGMDELAKRAESAEKRITELEGERDTAIPVVDAARALLNDVRRRHPGEELRCPFMQGLDAALSKTEGKGC